MNTPGEQRKRSDWKSIPESKCVATALELPMWDDDAAGRIARLLDLARVQRARAELSAGRS